MPFDELWKTNNGQRTPPLEFEQQIPELFWEHGRADPDAAVLLPPSGSNRMAHPGRHRPLLMIHPGDDPVAWRAQILPGSNRKLFSKLYDEKNVNNP